MGKNHYLCRISVCDTPKKVIYNQFFNNMNRKYIQPTIDELEMVVEAGFSVTGGFEGDQLPSFDEEELPDSY